MTSQRKAMKTKRRRDFGIRAASSALLLILVTAGCAKHPAAAEAEPISAREVLQPRYIHHGAEIVRHMAIQLMGTPSGITPAKLSCPLSTLGHPSDASAAVSAAGLLNTELNGPHAVAPTEVIGTAAGKCQPGDHIRLKFASGNEHDVAYIFKSTGTATRDVFYAVDASGAPEIDYWPAH